MKMFRPIAIVAASLMLAQAAFAQAQPTPPAVDNKPAAKKEVPKEKKAPAAAKKQAPAATPAPTAMPVPAPSTTQAPPSVFDDPNVDLVYGAYQRGMYKTAFDLAMNRAQYNGDPKAMTGFPPNASPVLPWMSR